MYICIFRLIYSTAEVNCICKLQSVCVQLGLTENQNQPGFSYGGLNWSLVFCFQKQISLQIFTYEYPLMRLMC